MLSFVSLEQFLAIWFTATGGFTAIGGAIHVGIHRQKTCAQAFAVRYSLDGKPARMGARMGMISSDRCPIQQN
jgi:hypothetical protein